MESGKAKGKPFELHGHKWEDIRAAYPLPARLVKDVEEERLRVVELRRHLTRVVGPIMLFVGLTAAVSGWLLGGAAIVLAVLGIYMAVYGITCFEPKDISSLDRSTGDYGTVPELTADGQWRTLRQVLKLTKAGSPLLPIFIESALSIDESRRRGQALEESVAQLAEESHPPETLDAIINNKLEMIREERDPAIKKLLEQQVRRLEESRMDTRNINHSVDLMQHHKQLIDKAEQRLLEMVKEHAAWYALDDELVHAYREAVPRLAVPVSKSETAIHSTLAILPEQEVEA